MRRICIIPRQHYILICHERLDAIRDLVINARTGDYGPFLIKQARKKLLGMDINIKVMGA